MTQDLSDLRQRRASAHEPKGALSHKTARIMVFKLVMAASRTWRRLKGENRLPMVIAGVRFTDGVAVTEAPDQRAA